MFNLNRLVIAGVVLALILGGAIWGIRQYGNSRVAAQELGSVKEAVQEAVAAREESLKADVATEAQKRTTVQRVRVLAVQARKELNELDSKLETIGVPCAPNPESLRVWNDLIAEGNRAIESSR